MSFENITSSVVDFFNTHTILAIALVIAIIVFAFWRPKAVFKLGAFILIIGVVIFLVGLVGGLFTTSVKHKDDLTHKTDQSLDPASIGGSFADKAKQKIDLINKK